MIQPQITAVLPCFNHSAFLEERINSVLAQTLPVSQIIFLDDASTDGSLALAQKLLAKTSIETAYKVNKTNLGSPFIQWNKGLHLAKHPFIWIAETDDTCNPQLLSMLFERMTESRAVLAFAQSRYIDELGNDLGSALSYTDVLWPGVYARNFVMPGSEFNSRFMMRMNAIPNASAVLFRRDSHQRRVIANESMQFCGDWDFWSRIADQGNVAFIAEELNGFRCHKKTTRANGYTPQAESEGLAYRLGVYFRDHHTSTSSLNLLKLLQLLRQSDRSRIQFIIGAVAWVDLGRVRAHYRKLDNVPAVSTGAWAIIAIFSLRSSCFHMFLRVKHMLSSQFKRFLSIS